MNIPVLIIGTGGHARRVAQAVKLNGDVLLGFADESPTAVSPVPEYPLLAIDAVVSGYKTGFVVAIGNAQVRARLQGALVEAGLTPLCVVHPRAYVAIDAQIGEGSVVLAGAIVESGAMIGQGAIIDIGAIVDHDAKIGEFCHLRPGVVIGAREQVGDRETCSGY